MSLDARLLLEGPRGRRLLLEFAVLSEALASHDVTTELPLWKSLFDHAVATGTEKLVTGWGEDYIPRATTPEHLGRQLAVVRLVGARPTLLFDAMQRSVASSRAGLTPEPIDALLDDWRLDGVLGRVAEHVVTTGRVGWWHKPTKRDDQWSVDVSSVKGGKGPGRHGADRVLAQERRHPGEGGWRSAPPSGLVVTSRRWPRRAPLDKIFREDGRVATLAPRKVPMPRSLKVAEIHGAEDWAALCRSHPVDVTRTHGAAWAEATGRVVAWAVPDWASVAERYDAVHLSVAGYLSASGRAIPLDEQTSSMMTGWGPGQVVWLVDPPQ